MKDVNIVNIDLNKSQIKLEPRKFLCFSWYNMFFNGMFICTMTVEQAMNFTTNAKMDSILERWEK